MDKIILILILFMAFSCGPRENNDNIEKLKTQKQSINLVLPESLENRSAEFTEYITVAKENIRKFCKRNGWEGLSTEIYFDSIMIFDSKKEFDFALLTIAGENTNIVLPKTYCAALEQRTLMAMTPEYYEEVYPEGKESHSYEKLLTHEIAHRVHISILKGNEDAMGPVWFYEGFAIYAANQFEYSDLSLNKSEMISVVNNPERSNYKKYSFVFRLIVNEIPLKELVEKAASPDFNKEIEILLDSIAL
jgi:hypothetical protein